MAIAPEANSGRRHVDASDGTTQDFDLDLYVLVGHSLTQRPTIALGYLATQPGIKPQFITASDLMPQIEAALRPERDDLVQRHSAIGPR